MESTKQLESEVIGEDIEGAIEHAGVTTRSGKERPVTAMESNKVSELDGAGVAGSGTRVDKINKALELIRSLPQTQRDEFMRSFNLLDVDDAG